MLQVTGFIIENNCESFQQMKIVSVNSSWSQSSMDLSVARRIIDTPDVTMISLSSEQLTEATLVERDADSSCLLVLFCKNAAQLPESLLLPSAFLWTPFPSFLYLIVHASGDVSVPYHNKKDLIDILLECHSVGSWEKIYYSSSIKKLRVDRIWRFTWNVLDKNSQLIWFLSLTQLSIIRKWRERVIYTY